MNLHMRILHFGFLVGFFTVLGLCGVLLLDLFKLSYLPWRDARSQGAARGVSRRQASDSLGQIAEVPIPDDPATGKPLEYHRDGAAALLVAADAGLKFPPSFRLTVRPREDTAKP
jgi:hypothetical protein